MIGQNSKTYQNQTFWQIVKTSVGVDDNLITTQQTLPAGANITHAVVEALADANKVIITVPNGVSAIELRFYGDDSDAGADTVELHAGATTDSLTDFYRHFAQLALTMGTGQRTAALTFYDTIVPANENWLSTMAEASPANNTFASYVFNTHGYNKFLVTVSSAISDNLYVEWKEL